HAQWIYLQVLAKVRPEVLGQLSELCDAHVPQLLTAAAGPIEFCDVDPFLDEYDPWITGWQRQFGLRCVGADDWARAYARSTIAGWLSSPNSRRDKWWPRTDGTGLLLRNENRKLPQTRRPRISPAHFVWLVRYQTGESYSLIARTRAAHVNPSWS